MSRVIDARGSSDVPDFWDEKGWARPFHFLRTVEEQRSKDDAPAPRPYLTDCITSGFDYRRAISRTSLTRTADDDFPLHAFQSALRCLYVALAAEDGIVAGVITQSVSSWKDAYWILEHEPRHLRASREPFDPSLTSKTIQGQAWAVGPGATVVLALDWERVAVGDRDVDVAYADALVTCGRIGQALVVNGQHDGVSARMTPAVHESTASKLFQFPDHVSPLYAVRLAKPAD